MGFCEWKKKEGPGMKRLDPILGMKTGIRYKITVITTKWILFSIDKLVFLNLSDEFPFSELSIGALDGATK